MSRQYVGPYINFAGRAREAMEFYQKVLGGKLDLQALWLEVDGTVITATEGHPDYPAKVGENMAMAVGGTERDRLARIFTALADGGRIKQPLTKQGSAEVGWLTDKFGINWMVSIEKA